MIYDRLPFDFNIEFRYDAVWFHIFKSSASDRWWMMFIMDLIGAIEWNFVIVLSRILLALIRAVLLICHHEEAENNAHDENNIN